MNVKPDVWSDWDDLRPEQKVGDIAWWSRAGDRCHAAYPIGVRGNHTWVSYTRCASAATTLTRYCKRHLKKAPPRPKSWKRRMAEWLVRGERA